MTPPHPLISPDPSLEAVITTAEATENLAFWAEKEVLVDLGTALFTAVAAAFAIAAYRQTKRQAQAAERQANYAHQELEHNREAMSAQTRAAALSLRPTLVPRVAALSLKSHHPQARIQIQVEPRGTHDIFELQAGIQIYFRIPGEKDWLIEPNGKSPDFVDFGHMPHNVERSLVFDQDYDEQKLTDAGDTWLEFQIAVFLDWQDAMNWELREEWLLTGRIRAMGGTKATIERTALSDYPPE